MKASDKRTDSDTASPSRRSRARTASREHLIEATLEIIFTRGIDAVRLDEVISAVGVTKGSLYWHFADREDLIRQALAEHLRRLNEELIQAAHEALDEATTPEEYLAAIGPAIADPYDPDQVEERWRKLELLATSRRDPELSSLMNELQVRSLRNFVEITTRARDAGLLRSELDPVALAVALSALGLGSNLISVLGDEAPTREAWFGLMLFFIQQTFPIGEE